MKSRALLALVVIIAAVPLPARPSDEPVFRVGHGVTAPRPLNHPNPEYTDEALRAGIQGKCILSLVISSDGKPENVTVTRSLGMGLDENAVSAVRTWTFEPARKNGKPVAVQVSVVVSFRQGKDALRPELRQSLERGRTQQAAFRRTSLTRAYRVEGAGDTSLCRSAKQDGEDQGLPVLVPGLKGDSTEYRLDSIAFTGNNTLSNAAALRSLFPIQDGQRFDLKSIITGLQILGSVYRNQGFVTFKSSIDSEVDDSHRSIRLQINCDEGRQFYVDYINIAGLSPATFRRLRKRLYVRPGDIYNERLAALWLEKNSRFISGDTLAKDHMKLDVDDAMGTVALTYDFNSCDANAEHALRRGNSADVH